MTRWLRRYWMGLHNRSVCQSCVERGYEFNGDLRLTNPVALRPCPVKLLRSVRACRTSSPAPHQFAAAIRSNPTGFARVCHGARLPESDRPRSPAIESVLSSFPILQPSIQLPSPRFLSALARQRRWCRPLTVRLASYVNHAPVEPVVKGELFTPLPDLHPARPRRQ